MRARPGGGSGATFLLPEGIFVAPALNRGAAARPSASLPVPGPLGMLRMPPQPAEARLPGVLGEACRYAKQLPVLRFCVNELLPLLRSSGNGVLHCGGAELPLSPIAFQSLERRGLELVPRLHELLHRLGTPAALARRLAAPCAIAGGRVIPLSPVTGAEPPHTLIEVRGRRYVLRGEEARPYASLLADLRREQERRTEEIVQQRSLLGRMASEFLADVKSILDRCRPKDRGGHQLFFHDLDHQLQHSRGHWLLMRGPVATRLREGSAFVGLHLIGRSRREWLAVPPRPSPAQHGFWAPDGSPLLAGICVGDWGQYQRLCSDWFTDAGAVIEWLDAGVILVTSRSAIHQRLRATGRVVLRGPGRPLSRRPARPC